MEARPRRPGRSWKRVGIPIAVAMLVLTAVGVWLVSRASNRAFERAPWTSVVKVELVQIPEGSPPPPFEDPAMSPVSYDLGRLAPYAPAALPAPVAQHGCDIGGSMVITLSDGRMITYGPCRYPPSIERLWAGIEYLLTGGDCAPRCGPGGMPGP